MSEDVRAWMRWRRRLYHFVGPTAAVKVAPEVYVALLAWARETSDNLGVDLFHLGAALLFLRTPVVIANQHEAPFLRAIDADPNDGLTKLIYADWLAERGLPEEEEWWRKAARYRLAERKP